MQFFQRFRFLFYMLTTLSILSFYLAENDGQQFSIGIYLFAFVGIVTSWLYVDATKGRVFPRWLVNMGVLFSSLILFYELVMNRNTNLLFALGHFMICILVCKLFEQRGPRDFGQILTLSLLVIVAAAIFNTSLAFGLILVLYLVLGLLAILLFHLYRQLNGPTIDTAAATTAARSRASVRMPQASLSRDLFHVLTSSWAIVISSAALIFLGFPRNVGRNWMGVLHGAGVTAFTGFSDRVQFGEIRRMQQSDVPVMEVKLERDGQPMGSPYYQPYFRGMVLDRYDVDTRSWQRSHTENDGEMVNRTDVSETPRILAPRSFFEPTPMLTQHYTMRGPNPGHVLFTIYPAVSISSDSIRAIAFDRLDYTFVATGASKEHFACTIESPIDFSPEISPRGVVQHLIDYFRRTAVSDSSPAAVIPPRVAAMAKDVVAKLPHVDPAQAQDVVAAASMIENYLRTHYPYSLEIGTVDPTIDPTEDFLYNRQKKGGHCEYFASAMVMMARSLGLDARMVTGYHGGEFNSVGGYYLVRQRDAHAWVEVYVPAHGWQRFDPSPAGGDSSGDADSWTHWFSEIGQYIDKTWLANIIFFDDQTRASIEKFFYDNFGVHFVNVWNLIESVAHQVVSDAHNGVGGIIRLIVIVILSTIVLYLAWQQLQRIRERGSAKRAARRVDSLRPASGPVGRASFLSAMFRILRQMGIQRQPAQTPQEVLNLVQQPEVREHVSWLVTRFYAVRFGGQTMTAALQTQIHERIATLRLLVRQTPRS
jgi:transglutaminase-like putative cysteine protease